MRNVGYFQKIGAFGKPFQKIWKTVFKSWDDILESGEISHHDDIFEKGGTFKRTFSKVRTFYLLLHGVFEG